MRAGSVGDTEMDGDEGVWRESLGLRLGWVESKRGVFLVVVLVTFRLLLLLSLLANTLSRPWRHMNKGQGGQNREGRR